MIRRILIKVAHLRAQAKLKDIEQRKRHLRKEIGAAHIELMRLNGQEAIERHRLRMM